MPDEIGFIITKPLQLLVAIAIIEDMENNTNVNLIIVGSFQNAEDVSRNLRRFSQIWGLIYYCETQKNAYQHALKSGYTKLFIDSDIGYAKWKQLIKYKIFNPRSRIAVYEEGLGTYRTDLYSGLKKLLLNLIGVATYFGGCSLTDEIYVYQPDLYFDKVSIKYKKPNAISVSINTIIDRYQNQLANVFDFSHADLPSKTDSSAHTCFIYLSSWEVDESALKLLSTCVGEKFVKLHPHITKTIQLDKYGLCSIKPSIPAEILISHTSLAFDKVKVFHHGSSVTSYIQRENVEFIRL